MVKLEKTEKCDCCLDDKSLCYRKEESYSDVALAFVSAVYSVIGIGFLFSIGFATGFYIVAIGIEKLF